MKSTCLILLFTATLFLQGYSCGDKEPLDPPGTNTQYNEPGDDSTSTKMKITIGTKDFTVTLSENETVKKFKAMLPLTIEMKELNRNEKFSYLSVTLPTGASNPGVIQAGDLMLYGNNCIVLFYKTFQTSYSYTKIGRVDDVSDLEATLGSGSVNVKFEMK